MSQETPIIDKSDIFPDLQIDVPAIAQDTTLSEKDVSTDQQNGTTDSIIDNSGGGVKTTSNIETTSGKSSNSDTKLEKSLTAKQILLKYQCLPHYPTTEESREKLLAFMERCSENEVVRDWLSNRDDLISKIEGGKDQNSPNLDTAKPHLIQEHVIILHSLFSEFCTPPPSIESICNIFLLETQRVAALRGRGASGPSCKIEEKHEMTDLPKEPLIHTATSSAQFIIALLRSSPKSCFLKLPLEFQLSFFRVLMRLLSEEGDQEYDEECLFDWSFMHDKSMKSSDKEDTRYSMGARGEGEGTSKDPSLDNELDGSYHVIQRRSSFSSNNQTKLPGTIPTSSFNRSNSSIHNNSDIATQIWSYANWKKKKSSPLYATIRFCSNLAWKNDSVSSSPLATLNSSFRRQHWDFVAENVKLNEDEEEELMNETLFEGSSEEGGMDVGMSGKKCGAELVGQLIKIYQALIDECSAAGGGLNTKGHYLLFGPVAHLLGLIISATGTSVKNLRTFLVLAEGSELAIHSSKLKLRRPSLCSNSRSTKKPLHCHLYLARLHIIRMLRYTAEYSAQSNGILDKVGPQSFFSFGDGRQGLSTTVFNKPWPFRHDFCVACWFRAETFVRASVRSGGGDNSQNTVLFRARSFDGAKIEVSFESCSSDFSAASAIGSVGSTAATLVVTVTDAHELNTHAPRKVRLVGCVLTPLVWYHVAVRLTKSKSGPFSMNFNNKNELSIHLNGKLMLREQMKLPKFVEQQGAFSGGLASVGLGSFGRQVSSGSKTSPIELSFFSNFDGQAGSLYVFNEHVSEDTIIALYRATVPQAGQAAWFTFSDGWDASRSKLGHIAKALSSASMLSELDDVVLPNYPGEYV